jgi:prepilin-type N-terminal cleavage/methylation domain-containing protein
MLARLTRALRGREAGFTLIELMIVILVILILAAILVPQFGLAQERARKAKCVSNQRNLETAVAMWSTDNPNTLYTGGAMNASIPGGPGSGTNMAGTPQYTLSAAFVEPDDSAVTDGSDYYMSNGSASGALANATQSAPSYGHVACNADKTADAWVASYDGTSGSISGINHTRGAAASP